MPCVQCHSCCPPYYPGHHPGQHQLMHRSVGHDFPLALPASSIEDRLRSDVILSFQGTFAKFYSPQKCFNFMYTTCLL